ncbi:MAG: hypothetical protein ACTH4J_04540 [Vibrio toranzoniae]|uniref:hypothetical protein n=1 Tax=Vibrio toranzoniae TaxID=1194427 RepID=UPI003F98697B
MDSIYFDNEPNHGINAYFPWGHNFFKTPREFFQFMEVHYGMVSSVMTPPVITSSMAFSG